MTRSRPSHPVAAVAILVALALVAAACDSTGNTTTSTREVTETTAAPASETTATTTTPSVGFTYKVGIFGDIGRSNFWALWGPGGQAMDYVFGRTKPSLFRIAYPGLVVAPDVASGLSEPAVQEGEVWTVTQPIRDDYTWSDGSLLTADDIVFTFETVRDVGLGPLSWWTAYPYPEGSSPRLLDVEAIDDFTVRYTFDTRPGAATWPHAVGVAPIMPRAPWEAVVAEALASENPAEVLYDADAVEVGDLSGGPVSYNGREEGVSVETIGNDNYANTGFVHQFWADGSYALNGELLYGEGVGDPVVEYTEGPYLERTVFSIYDNEEAGMLALINGEIDYWFPPSGVPSTQRRRGLEADNLAVTVNPSNGWQYLGFNLRQSPGKFLGFRQAMAYFDKETLTNNVLQGAFTPLYVMVPEGNQAWYDEDIAGEIASRYVGLPTSDRLAAAYGALEADGFTWETPAVFDDDGTMVSPGAGIIDPEGNPVPVVEILVPDPQPFAHSQAATFWLEDWAESLGIPAEANKTDINTVVDSVWPGIGTEPVFDMYVLGWTLGNPAWPTFHEEFFHTRNMGETNDGGNSAGYSNPEFDALADAMFTETEYETAYSQVWQMERMIAEDLPYVVLFSAPITEFYNEDLLYPFTQTLSGIRNLGGMQGTVSK